ncbi:MAG TPA: DMT family transporter [Dehalococcoidia bacterium]|jgi:drug/metabolite transporter (DMT)-like permease|nr:DMT family transporter [Dehalococcoidia bacterium]
MATDQRRPLSGRAAVFAVILAALWGGNSVSVKAGLRDAPPLRLAWMRTVLGGAVVLLWALATKQSLRVGRGEWVPLTGLGVLFAAQIVFMNIGQDKTTAGHAAVIISTFPLWTGVIAHFLVPGDRLSVGRATGTVIAYTGVIVIFSSNLGSETGVAGDLMMLVSAALLGTRVVYLSQTSQSIEIHKLLMAQTVVSTVIFVLASLLTESDPHIFTEQLVVALFYQGVVIAGFGFMGNTWLLQRFLPSRVAALQLATPAISVVLSAIVLGESVGTELVAGVALVASGSALAQR